jgi:hypothetical protein
MNRRGNEAAQRSAERRRREDEAPRLIQLIPNLAELKLELRETRSLGEVTETSHTRRIVVERAPALFELPCLDSSCRDGGHDVTHAILKGLRGGETRFDGTDVCRGVLGTVGTAECGRVLSYVVEASYCQS